MGSAVSICLMRPNNLPPAADFSQHIKIFGTRKKRMFSSECKWNDRHASLCVWWTQTPAPVSQWDTLPTQSMRNGSVASQIMPHGDCKFGSDNLWMKKSQGGKLSKRYHVLALLEFLIFLAGKSTSWINYSVPKHVCSLLRQSWWCKNRWTQ